MTNPEESELISHIHDLFNKLIPFNKILGITVDRMDSDSVVLRLNMRKELIGNYMIGSLHGGVISSILDTAGGLAALMGMMKTSKGTSAITDLKMFKKLATIDLRIDYLRPGIGKYFLATAYIIRSGKRVSVSRMELHNGSNKLIAVGTGTYIVS